MKLHPVWALALAASTLTACGGGGGGTDAGATSSTTRAALPYALQDLNPAGDRVDLRSQNYFPTAVGDTWRYDRVQGTTSTGTLTRSVTAGTGADVVVTESWGGANAASTSRRTTDGILSVAPLAGSAPLVASRIVGDLLEYPEPFYAVGSTRRIVRQGDWGADADGDGVNDSFRLEITQLFIGLETVTLPSRTLTNVAHFRNVSSFTLQPSALKNDSQSSVSTEDEWWAPGIGLVRTERSQVNSNTSTTPPAPYSMVLTGGTVAGTPLFGP